MFIGSLGRPSHKDGILRIILGNWADTLVGLYGCIDGPVKCPMETQPTITPMMPAPLCDTSATGAEVVAPLLTPIQQAA